MRLSKFTKKGVAVALALSWIVVGNAGDHRRQVLQRN